MKKLTKEQWINKAKSVHGDRYDYSNTIYIGNKGKLIITCGKHGDFVQIATRHLTGDGCPKCNGGVLISQIEFIEKAKVVHGEKYDYSLVEYKNSGSKVKIICNKHGVFEIKANNHTIQKQGCRACSIEKQTLTTNEFIEKAKNIHGDSYDYRNVSYKHNQIPILIICKKHGEFSQKPNSHLNGRGCKICKNSKGELKIINWLKNNNIQFESQKQFDDCKNILPLKFDFYLPDQNMVIEFDGDQHKKPNKFFGGVVGFQYRKKNDKIKDQYLKEKSIEILRISYQYLRNNKIEEMLKNNIMTVINH